ncbi:phage tail protein [Spongiimicrobium salis]|uniref:phage tail protein n=1 Tax=Spongiimicrobium salis TaxID=1667022 RepID=UPI00374CA0D9
MSDYPITGFYFRLSIPALSGLLDTSFKEVSGLQVEMGVEEIAEGGENRFKHRVPTGAKYQNLVLKRGVSTLVSPLSLWCEATLVGGLSVPITTQTVLLSLLNENSIPVKNWSFINAWPVKWEFSPLNSMNNEILIETLELSFDYSVIV